MQERDTNTLKWVFEGCWPEFPEAFEWEAYYLKQNRGTDANLDECWKVLEKQLHAEIKLHREL
jgi:hypothetical protein